MKKTKLEVLQTGLYVNLKGLRKTHIQQLMAYAAARESDGWTYGNKRQFQKRHGELVDWLDEIVEILGG